ncbi:MAG: hypothetical protein V2A65_08995 [Candidatus Omnitrophota bacterium]
MNERERVMAVFKGEIPDRTPWYADLSYWYSGQRAMGRLSEKYEGDEGYLKLHQDTGSGFVLGSADQVPPDADFARICLVRKLLEGK